MKELRRRGIHSHRDRPLWLTGKPMAPRAVVPVNLRARYQVGFIRRYLGLWMRQLIQIGMQPHARERAFKWDRWRRGSYRSAPGSEVVVNASGNQQHCQQNPQDQALEHVVFLS